MLTRIRTALAGATRDDVIAVMVFAAAVVGMVEAPWVAQAMPIGPRSHASHQAASRLGHSVSIAIAKENNRGN